MIAQSTTRPTRSAGAAALLGAVLSALAGGAGCHAILGTDDIVIGECLPAELRCTDNTVQTCDDTGHWQDQRVCLAQLCEAGACLPNCEEGNDHHCTELVSVTPAGFAGKTASPPAGGNDAYYSFLTRQISVSADGRRVAFISAATDLIPDDTNGYPDAFVRDMDSGVITRVSVASDGTEADGPSASASISLDGKVVIFTSQAQNLVPVPTDGHNNVFVHELSTGKTEIISVAENGSPVSGVAVNMPVLSGDGRFAAFATPASLLATDVNGASDVYVRDRATGQSVIGSLSSEGQPGKYAGEGCKGNGGSNAFLPRLSADGRYLVFWSAANLLVPDDENDCSDLFLRDLQEKTTIRVSVRTDGADGEVSSYASAGEGFLSADGNRVVFAAQYKKLVPGDTNGHSDIFLRDLTKDPPETTRLNIPLGANQSEGGDADLPSISADGRFVAFVSDAPDLVPDDTNGLRDAFVLDRTDGTIVRVNVGPSGEQLDEPAEGVSLAAGGSYVVFPTKARVLFADQNSVFDTYRRRFH